MSLSQMVEIMPFSQLIKECSGQNKTVYEEHADSAEAQKYTELADTILSGEGEGTSPGTMSFEDLYEWWSDYIH